MPAMLDEQQRASLSRRTESLIAAGRVGAARPLLAALRRDDADDPALSVLEARLRVRDGCLVEAIAGLDDAIARHADDVALLLCRSELLLEAGDVTRAAGDAAGAVIADRRNPKAKATLGIVLLRMGRLDEALSCIAEAAAEAPHHPGLRVALAEARERTGDPEGAAALLDDAIARWPAELSLRAAAIITAMRRRAFQRAVALAEAARDAGVADANVFALLGHAHATLGAHDAAAEAYAEVAKLAPENPDARRLAAAATVFPSGTRAPAAYVEKLFDSYAADFEDHLLGLAYRIPGLIRAALIRHRPGGETLGDVLDLGCGTGFMGVALSDLPARRLVGADLSGAMLARALEKGIYAELRQCDIETLLHAGDETWDVVIAADVLTYFGALDDLFIALRPRLRDGGLLVFSAETLLDDMADIGDGFSGENWRLHRQGRYCHRASYLRDALLRAEMIAREIADEALRLEGGMPVAGLIVVAMVAPSR